MANLQGLQVQGQNHTHPVPGVQVKVAVHPGQAEAADLEEEVPKAEAVKGDKI